MFNYPYFFYYGRFDSASSVVSGNKSVADGTICNIAERKSILSQ